jgi:GR25 family glycosyltransferase involved in LPS biosynthesis
MAVYDAAIIISLERRQDRAVRVKKHLEARGIKNIYMFPAYDGKILPSYMLVSPPRRNYFSWMKLNNYQIACTLSHVGAMKFAKGLGVENALIFEDDAVLCKDFTTRLDIFEEESKGLDWEHIYFGGVPRKPQELKKVTEHLYTSGFTDGLQSYLVNIKGCDKISDAMLSFKTTNDDSVNDISQTGALKSYTFLPISSYQFSDFSELDQKFVNRTDMLNLYKETL